MLFLVTTTVLYYTFFFVTKIGFFIMSNNLTVINILENCYDLKLQFKKKVTFINHLKISFSSINIMS